MKEAQRREALLGPALTPDWQLPSDSGIACVGSKAERYREIVQWLGTRDPTTRKMMEEILATEEEHADDLVSLLEGLPGGMKAATQEAGGARV